MGRFDTYKVNESQMIVQNFKGKNGYPGGFSMPVSANSKGTGILRLSKLAKQGKRKGSA